MRLRISEMMRNRIIIITGSAVSAIGLVALLGLWWAVAEGPLRNPEEALEDFYEARDRAEDQLMDPLILNGRRVVPLVMKELSNKDMRLRRYAIGFLGNGRYSEALPMLEAILNDGSEIYYFRADALKAIFQISQARAKELAPNFVNSQEYLGDVAREIVVGRNPILSERSYWDAFRRAHD
jgi:hypothetical protein